jgi:hypothetical protein
MTNDEEAGFPPDRADPAEGMGPEPIYSAPPGPVESPALSVDDHELANRAHLPSRWLASRHRWPVIGLVALAAALVLAFVTASDWGRGPRGSVSSL